MLKRVLIIKRHKYPIMKYNQSVIIITDNPAWILVTNNALVYCAQPTIQTAHLVLLWQVIHCVIPKYIIVKNEHYFTS